MPDVVEIRLAPKGIDVDKIREELREKRRHLHDILESYDVDSAEDFRERLTESAALRQKLDGVEREIHSALGDLKWEDLKREAAAGPEPTKTVGELEHKIRTFCISSLDTFVGRVSGKIEEYEKKYTTIEKLSVEMFQAKHKVYKLREKIENGEQVSPEFASVTDLDQYDQDLKGKADHLEKEIEKYRESLSSAERSLGEKSAEEYADEYSRAVSEFEELKEEYRRWRHILEVFQEKRMPRRAILWRMWSGTLPNISRCSPKAGLSCARWMRTSEPPSPAAAVC